MVQFTEKLSKNSFAEFVKLLAQNKDQKNVHTRKFRNKQKLTVVYKSPYSNYLKDYL